jgi:exonuclease VII large subunit
MYVCMHTYACTYVFFSQIFLLQAPAGAAKLRAVVPLERNTIAQRRRTLARHVRGKTQHINKHLERARRFTQQLHARRLARQLQQHSSSLDLTLRTPLQQNLYEAL